jgi:predicted NAD/FAD-dependent oxidoreductase
MVDIAIVGAGLAGLICAQQLQQMGYQVVVVEKSRGVGGRVATRRWHGTCADHGVRYLDVQGALTQQLIQVLQEQTILDRWTDSVYELKTARSPSLLPDNRPRYVAPAGLTSIAKFLATGLEIWRNHRVEAITPTSQSAWSLTLRAAEADAASMLTAQMLTAQAIVLAIPAPQAAVLLEPLAHWGLPASFLDAVQSVKFDPCFSAIARYPPERQTDILAAPWKAVYLPDNHDIAWVGVDSRKRSDASQPIVVVHSTAAFARSHLETIDLPAIGQHLLTQAARSLFPWLAQPTDLQGHRWRYAFARQPYPDPYLATSVPLPLVCSGDWCGGNQLENALQSGLAAALATANAGCARSLTTAQPNPAMFAQILDSIMQRG